MARRNALLGTSDEAAIQAAISSYQGHSFKSVRAAAAAHGVSSVKLSRRLKGMPSVDIRRPRNTKLTSVEEQELINKVLDMDNRGLSPTFGDLSAMANCILLGRGGQPVAKNWSQRFVSNNQQLRTMLSRPGNHQRGHIEDLVAGRSRVDSIDNMMRSHGIIEHDTGNFDETGSEVGQASASVVVTTPMVLKAVDRLGKSCRESLALSALVDQQAEQCEQLIRSLYQRRARQKRHVAQGAFARRQSSTLR